MSFASDFTSCLSPLPAPADALDDVAELVHFLEKLHIAWEASGGSEEMLLAALIASGAGVGIVDAIGEAAALTAGVTVAAYIAACAACAAGASGSAIWKSITASNDVYIKNALIVAANDAGVAPTEATV